MCLFVYVVYCLFVTDKLCAYDHVVYCLFVTDKLCAYDHVVYCLSVTDKPYMHMTMLYTVCYRQTTCMCLWPCCTTCLLQTSLSAKIQIDQQLTERLGHLEAEKIELQDQFSVEQDVVVTLKTQLTNQDEQMAQKVNKHKVWFW